MYHENSNQNKTGVTWEISDRQEEFQEIERKMETDS